MSFASVFPRFGLDLVRLPRLTLPGAFLAAAFSLAGFSPDAAQAQAPGSLDTGFTTILSGVTVFTIGLRQNSDGTSQEILAGGDTRTLNVFGLNGDEPTTTDPTTGATLTKFTLPVVFGGVNFTTYALAFETTVPGTDIGKYDSRIFIGGLFGRYSADSPVGQNLTAINSDGSFDLNYNKGGRGTNGEVTAILPVFGGGFGTTSLFVGGLFTQYNDQDHNHIVRLTGTGEVDATFNPSLSADDTVFGLAQQIDPATGQPNGQVLVAGRFNRINNSEPAKLARLNADGSLDTTFNPNFDTRAFSIAVQPDGKIVVGGVFATVNGQSVNNIVRLNQDGTTDTSFAASITGNIEPVNVPPTAVNFVRLNPDGRIYAGGFFTTANGVKRQNIARFNPDGTLDTTFDPGAAVQNTVQSIAIQNDNNVVVGETRIPSLTTGGVLPPDLVRLIGGPLLSPAPPSVSIIATTRRAYRGSTLLKTFSSEGQFEITRNVSAAGTSTDAYPEPLTVSYVLTGASLTSDYNLFNDADPGRSKGARLTTGTVTIPPGSPGVAIDLLPNKVKGEDVPSPVKATMTLVPDGSNTYTVGSASSARVKILPPLQPPG